MMEINDTDITTWALPENAIARLGRGSVKDVAFSPDGECLVAATDSSTNFPVCGVYDIH